MKKLFFSAIMLLGSLAASAQFNLQLHYDLGRHINPDSEPDRQMVTTTAEFFNADKLGSTFMFIDLDYRTEVGANNVGRGVFGAYWEIGRDFTFLESDKGQHSITAHAEYDGGVNLSGPFQQALLLGPAWQWHSKDFSRTWTLQAMYKQFLKGADSPFGTLKAMSGFQLTGVWGMSFANGWWTFSGFADLWYGRKANNNEKGLVFLTEPQLWYNVLNKKNTKQKFSVGTEFEISNNFIWRAAGDRTFFLNPTVAMKWTF